MFYTYLWLREDGTPYYVGKGSNRRAFVYHESSALYPPPNLARVLVQEYPDEASAFCAEMFLIAFYGRKDMGTGCLRNRTNGGEGGPGNKSRTGQTWKQTPEWTAKIIAASKGKPRPWSLGNRSRTGWKNSPKWVEKMKTRMTGENNPNFGNHSPWSLARRAAYEAGKIKQGE
jgi:hypothetical protein